MGFKIVICSLNSSNLRYKCGQTFSDERELAARVRKSFIVHVYRVKFYFTNCANWGFMHKTFTLKTSIFATSGIQLFLCVKNIFVKSLKKLANCWFFGWNMIFLWTSLPGSLLDWTAAFISALSSRTSQCKYELSIILCCRIFSVRCSRESVVYEFRAGLSISRRWSEHELVSRAAVTNRYMYTLPRWIPEHNRPASLISNECRLSFIRVYWPYAIRIMWQNVWVYFSADIVRRIGEGQINYPSVDTPVAGHIITFY